MLHEHTHFLLSAGKWCSYIVLQDTTEFCYCFADEASQQNSSDTTSQCETEEGQHLDTSIPRQHKRKRKAEPMLQAVKAFLDLQKVQYEEFSRAEQARAQQECATMAQFMKAQQEADERRFKALQEQRSATTQMFVTLMNNVFRELRPGQPT